MIFHTAAGYHVNVLYGIVNSVMKNVLRCAVSAVCGRDIAKKRNHKISLIKPFKELYAINALHCELMAWVPPTLQGVWALANNCMSDG